MNNLKFDIRMLIVVGFAAAGCAVTMRNDDKSFQLFSNISSLCMGAAIGILKQEASEDNDIHDNTYNIGGEPQDAGYSSYGESDSDVY